MVRYGWCDNSYSICAIITSFTETGTMVRYGWCDNSYSICDIITSFTETGTMVRYGWCDNSYSICDIIRHWRHSSRAYCWQDLMSTVAWPPQKTAASNLKPSGRSGNAIYYTFPAKDTFVSSKKITARRSPCRAATA